jgi:RNA polymerase sigma-70 factor (ECF subfamily)
LADSEQTSSLARIYLEKRVNLVRFFTARTGSSAEAEDIVQDIYMKLATVDPTLIGNPAAFLYKLGTNIHLDRLRTQRRAQSRDGAYLNVYAAGSADEPTADSPSPEESWASRKQLAEVMAVVKSFPPQRLRVFTMHKLEGLSYGEVAGALGISKSAVEKHMMAALRQLAEMTP